VIAIPITYPDGSVSPKKFILKALINHVGTHTPRNRWSHCDVISCGQNVLRSVSVDLVFYEELIKNLIEFVHFVFLFSPCNISALAQYNVVLLDIAIYVYGQCYEALSVFVTIFR